jgi:hypothetical protein
MEALKYVSGCMDPNPQLKKEMNEKNTEAEKNYKENNSKWKDEEKKTS